MKRFATVAKKNKKSEMAENKIKQSLCHYGFLYDEDNPELIITVGGDGTLLYAVHKYLEKLDQLLFVAVHTGTLGFYTDYSENEIDECIQDIIENKIYEIFSSRLLKGEIVDFDKNSTTIYALNEMRLENILRTQTLDIFIDQEYFETIKGNGVCLSTQAGATAYNRSLKGAVVDNGLSIMQLVEIAGLHDSKHNSLGVPYIMKDDREITFISDNCENTYLCYDYIHLKLNKNVEKIICSMSDKKVRFARYRKYSYLKRLCNLY